MEVGILLASVFLAHVNSECWYRNLNLPEEAYSFWSSWGCYIYTRPDLFKGSPVNSNICHLQIGNQSYEVPGLIEDSHCHFFHHSDAYVSAKVQQSFLNNRSVTRWVNCSSEAVECCTDVMSNEPDVVYNCPSVWDGWTCFRSTPAGLTNKKICSRYAYSLLPPRCHHYSYKNCYDNATWNIQTDYSSCDITPPLILRNLYYIIVVAMSTLVCLPACLVLILLPTAASQKLSIIRALLIVICCQNIVIILVRSLIILPELTSDNPASTVMARNTATCRSLTFFEKFIGNAVFCCMLLFGIFLYQLLMNVCQIGRPNQRANMCPFYLGALIVATSSAIGWSVVMWMYHDDNCWQVVDSGNVNWLIDGPRLTILVANVILLLHVVVRLWHAFTADGSSNSPLLRALRSALICLPVFGMHFLFLIVHPDIDHCGAEQFYYIISYTIVAAQGVFVAVFHCYLEPEVSGQIIKWCRCEG